MGRLYGVGRLSSAFLLRLSEGFAEPVWRICGGGLEDVVRLSG